MPELIYKKAGHLELIRYRDSQRFLFNGVVQSLAPSITSNTTELEDGNSDWTYEFSTGKQGQVAVNLNSFQPRLYAALVTAEYETQTDLAIRKIEQMSVPAQSPYTVVLAEEPEMSPVETLVVVNDDDSPYVKVSSDPAAGQYALVSSTVTFNSADAETFLVAAYDFEADNALQMTMPESVNDDIFRVTVAGEAVNKEDEGTAYSDAIIFDRMRATGEIAWPPRQKEPQGWSFTLKMLKPRPGFKVVDYRVEA